MNRYPPPEEIRSGEQQKKLYLTAIKEIAHLRNMVKAENVVTKESRAELQETRKEVKQIRATNRSFRLQLTKKELASKHAANASKFAAIGGVLTEILYQTWGVTGFIGGSKWADWWTSDECVLVVMWCCTSIVGFVNRAAHE